MKDYERRISEWEIEEYKYEKRRRQRKERLIKSILLVSVIMLFLIMLLLALQVSGQWDLRKLIFREEVTLLVPAPEYDVQLLTPNEYSRPQFATEPITGIVIHYTANPGTSAQNNRDYFEGLKDSHLTKASSHFIVGLDGEIVQCIPTMEVAYASNSRNIDTVSIETCYINEDGSYEQATYDTLVHLTAWLMGKFNLKTDDVIRHYDITGKNCPKYFVENEEAWLQFKKDVQQYIDENGELPKEE